MGVVPISETTALIVMAVIFFAVLLTGRGYRTGRVSREVARLVLAIFVLMAITTLLLYAIR